MSIKNNTPEFTDAGGIFGRKTMQITCITLPFHVLMIMNLQEI